MVLNSMKLELWKVVNYPWMLGTAEPVLQPCLPHVFSVFDSHPSLSSLS